MQNFDTLSSRAKTRLGITSDGELCRRLDYPQTRYSAVKNKRRPMPFVLEIKLRYAAGETPKEILAKHIECIFSQYLPSFSEGRRRIQRASKLFTSRRR